MPIQEYRCLACNIRYEALIRTGNSELESRCPDCGSVEKEYCPSAFSSKITSIHPSERPVILINDKGEIKHQMRNDQPIHPKYAAQGFRKSYAFETFSERDAFEKKTGTIHERSHYETSDAAEKDLQREPTDEDRLSKIKHRLNHLRTL